MTASGDDARWMAAALTLARRGLGRTAPNPPVGAVLVSPGGSVIARGWTQPGGRPHAERVALEAADEAARGATLYVTLEPCSHFGKTSPCADAVVAAGVARVVAAMEDPDERVAGRGLERLRAAGIEVLLGVGEQEARRLAAGHVSRVTRGRPHVALKLAVSADGKAGLAGRRPMRITGEAANARVHMMRAEADAIMVGVGTVLADDPQLTCRLPGMNTRSPIRVVLDSAFRTPPTSQLVATTRETPTWIVATPDAPEASERTLRDAGVDTLRTDRDADGRPALEEALRLLAERGVTRLMVEGGPTLAAELLRREFVDEATLFLGSASVGPDGVDALEGLALETLTASDRFTRLSDEPVGADRMLRLERCG